MIEVIPFNEINKAKWDECVNSSIHNNIYGLYDSISQACDHWVGIVYEDYKAVLALPLKKKLGLAYSWHPQFMGPLGVFSSVDDPEIESEIFSRTLKNSWWIKMYYWQNSSPKEFKKTQLVFQILDLRNSNMDILRSLYNENTKRNIKKAIKAGLNISHDSTVEELVLTFKENKGDKIENINDESYTLLKKLMKHWLKTKNGHISSIYQNDELLAIGYFLSWKGITIYYKGVVTERGKTAGAMHFLIDQEIEKSIVNGNYFDFGGSNSESVARFYRGFGGVDKNYYLHEFKKFKI
jgi:hypothetical protein